MANFNTVIQKLWRNQNPYHHFPNESFPVDTQGWGSQHPYLADTVTKIQPELIVEIGVWKGGSSIEMGKSVLSNNLNCSIISIDTYLGAWDHWINNDWFGHLNFRFGYPTLFYTFLSNVISAGLENVIVPLPLDSANAAIVLDHFGLYPSVIHIDGGHDFDTVLHDMIRWWPLLKKGGTMIMDDYDCNGTYWQTVKRAVDSFLSGQIFSNFEAINQKCRFTKN